MVMEAYPIFRPHVTDMTKNLWTTKENDGKSWQMLRKPKKNGGKTTEDAGTTHGTCWDQGKCQKNAGNFMENAGKPMQHPQIPWQKNLHDHFLKRP